MPEVKLQRPGAGLPLLEALLTRYFIFPRAVRRLTWESADEFFRSEAHKILELAESVDEELRNTPVLIPRLRGIEDSSRHWSIAMTLEHLMIVGGSIKSIIPRLLRGERIAERVDIAAVKPHTGAKPEICSEFRGFVAEYLRERKTWPAPSDISTKLYHPWLGLLSPFAWHVLAAVHLKIHRAQIKAILSGLKEVA